MATVSKWSWFQRPALGLLLILLLLSACGEQMADPPTIVPTAPITPMPSITPVPTQTPLPTPTATPLPTPAPTIDPTTFLQQTRANELGWVLVLEYHMIDEPEGRWTRTPDNFRQDVARLIAEDYYPINLIDLAQGYIDVPAGKTPIVLTFDDSSSGQCRYLDDGTIDPNTAVGILLAAADQHPDDWRPRATFFVLLDVDVDDRVLFGQPEWAERKLQDMVAWGLEIGSHTISHFRLDQGTLEEVHWQLAVSEETIEAMIPGYEVSSLSVPLGMYPDDEELIKAGDWEGQHYDFVATVEVAGGPSPSPFSKNFLPYHIRRTQVFETELEDWLSFFQNYPELRYISDGDPSTIAIPNPLPERLQGILPETLPEGMTLLQYAPIP